MAGDFSVRFWGVRGSIACSGPRTARYGGNTSSLEVRCGERMLMFDAGTGLRYLGNSLISSGPIDVDLFLTHTHFDHVCGLPFFKPVLPAAEPLSPLGRAPRRGHDAAARARRVHDVAALPGAAAGVPRAHGVSRVQAPARRCARAGDVAVRTATLNHPDGATGYRVEYGGRSLCYLTDTEHVPGAPDRNILELIAGADLVIYDSMYTDAEYDTYVGWGHSTWQEGVRLCRAAGAKRMAVFHHDPEHDDDMLDGIAREVEKELPGSVVAKDGLVSCECLRSC